MHFDRFGLSFDYPDNWSVDLGDSAGQHAAVTVYAPGGGFWAVSGHAAGGDAAELAAAVERQMREEYRDLDAEAAEDDVAGRRLPGIDFNFYCLDLTNTAQLRTLTLPGSIYLLFCQAEDRDWEQVAPVFAAMTASFVSGLDRRSPASDAGTIDD
jgi:hypothetical protein